jgi:hypothetical protein
MRNCLGREPRPAEALGEFQQSGITLGAHRVEDVAYRFLDLWMWRGFALERGEGGGEIGVAVAEDLHRGSCGF